MILQYQFHIRAFEVGDSGPYLFVSDMPMDRAMVVLRALAVIAADHASARPVVTLVGEFPRFMLPSKATMSSVTISDAFSPSRADVDKIADKLAAVKGTDASRALLEQLRDIASKLPE